ncbi:MAG: hypothetical protein HY556_00415 [Euryarchaeota archaeon]|nr:hypothetical protein [Euryarchaeota archaeon]
MKARALLPLILVFGGCLSVGAPSSGSPLQHPKLLLADGYDGRVEVYVHSAFGELRYDWLNLSLDNATSIALNDTYALNNKTGNSSFHLRIDALRAENRFYYELDFALNASGESARITPYKAGVALVREARETALPFEKLLERVDINGQKDDGATSP